MEIPPPTTFLIGEGGLERCDWEGAADGIEMNGLETSKTPDLVFFTPRRLIGEVSLSEMPLRPARMLGVRGVFASERARLRLGVFGIWDMMAVEDKYSSWPRGKTGSTWGASKNT